MALKRELGLVHVFCIASGAMISSGLFILPGLAYSKAGPVIIICYFFAGLLSIPGMLSLAEMTTAMPKAGGDCFQGRLNEIRCPVLLTASLADEYLPNVEDQLPAMAKQIENCRFFLAKSGEHPLMWSNSTEFRREADIFLTGIDAIDD